MEIGKEIINHLDEKKIDYFILRSSNEKSVNANDIDLFVETKHYSNVLFFIKHNGYVEHVNRHKYDKQFINLNNRGQINHIHLQSNFYYFNSLVISYDEIKLWLKKNILEVEYLYYLIRLANGSIAKKRRIEKENLYDQRISEKDRIKLQLFLFLNGVKYFDSRVIFLRMASFSWHLYAKYESKLKRRILSTLLV